MRLPVKVTLSVSAQMLLLQETLKESQTYPLGFFFLFSMKNHLHYIKAEVKLLTTILLLGQMKS